MHKLNVRVAKAHAAIAACAFGLVAFPLFAREEVDLGFGWRFADGPRSDAMKVDCDDGETVDLPHDFQFAYPWNKNASAMRGFKAMGTGWYRKRIFANPAWRGKRVALDFGGVLCRSEVWLNGEKVAEDDYGYLGFEVDVSNSLRWGETNVVAVMATTGEVGCSRWYTGGGLYRGVKLVVRDQISISRHGVYVTTPVVADGRAEVSVEIDIDGYTRCTNDLTVAVSLLSPDGGEVCRSNVRAPRDCREKRIHVTLPRMALESPQRWDIDSPALYTAVVSLVEDGIERDRVKTRFGIRTVEFGTEFGFKLNGRKVFLKSMCNHHDLGALGAAAYPRAIERQFRLMKEFGFNAIRCSHNPYSQEFMDLADELGILVVDELADKWSGGRFAMGSPMTESFFPRITEWVRRDRNHPSVILWSLGNELQHDEEFSGFQSDDGGVTTYKIFDTVVKRWDPTRKTTVAMYPASDSGYGWRESEARKLTDAPRLAFATDVASFNYVWKRYPDFFRQKPDMVLFQSEAVVRELLEPYWGMDRSRTVGLSYWGAIEYWGESQGWPAKGWNYSFFGHDLTPRPTAYLIRCAFRPDEPLVRLAVFDGGESHVWNDVNVGCVNLNENWNRRAGEKVRLVGFTNAEEAELFLNGESCGVRRNDAPEGARRNILKWDDVAFTPGRVEIVARTGGREVARHALETAGKAVRLVAEPESGTWRADGYDLLYVRLRAVDEAGRTVPDADAKVSVNVSGPARLLALDDGDHDTDGLFDVDAKRMRGGRLLAVFRAGRTAGEVRISFSAEGLPPVEMKRSLREDAAYLFAYFSGKGYGGRKGEAAGMRLAYSYDGLKWTPLADEKPFLVPKVGKSKLLRDPSICQGPDGTFHAVWTTGWEDRCIGHAASADLVEWGEQQEIPVMAHEPDAQNCWAPEVTYNPDDGLFYIYWATTIPGRHSGDGVNQKGRHGKHNHRIYLVTTRDWKTFSPTRLWFNPAFSAIDAALLRVGGQWLMTVKNENDDAKDIHIVWTTNLAEPWDDKTISDSITDARTEGPSPLMVGGGIFVYFDRYTQNGYGVVKSSDGGKTWQDVSKSLTLPKGIRHGTAFAVSKKMVDSLVRKRIPTVAVPLNQ